jgi:hypothetical protein
MSLNVFVESRYTLVAHDGVASQWQDFHGLAIQFSIGYYSPKPCRTSREAESTSDPASGFTHHCLITHRRGTRQPMGYARNPWFGERRTIMRRRVSSTWAVLTIMCVVAALATAYAQLSPGDFPEDPDKTMASAHEAFLKKDTTKAAEDIHKAAEFVKKEADKVGKDVKAGVVKAGADLDKFGRDVKAGTVKTGDDLKKAFAKVDHELAKAWHKTADEAKKAGTDSGEALKKAGAGLEGAAKWSGAKLKEGTLASVEGLKKVGQGAKVGAEDVGKFFKGIGDGIADVGRHITASR